jgi:hypothetical protein
MLYRKGGGSDSGIFEIEDIFAVSFSGFLRIGIIKNDGLEHLK